MLTELLFVPIVLAYLAILCALFVYGMNFIYLTFVALRTGDRQPAKTIPDTWPIVTVQLPIYNEYYVAGRLIDAAAQLDYPADRLEIQVLDDSTDDTSTVVAHLVAKWRDQGVDIHHVRREGREGYKAGALRHGLESARGEFVAIFDADFVPRPDFLREAVPAMVADSQLAFVQTRWGHVNREFSLLTRLQAVAIDGHFGIEQAGRWARGYCFNFNGTAGVWRRRALLDVGGWQDDTLTEDLDVSYRAFMAGWRAGYLREVEAPAELPVSMSAYRRQQHRWARGSFECAVKHLPPLWRSELPFARKVSATLHLTGYFIHLLLLVLSLLYPVILLVAEPHPELFALLGVLGIFNLTTLAPTLMFTVGQRQVGRRWLLQLPTVMVLSVLGCGMMVNTARAGYQTVRGGPAAFERTPKFGVRSRRDDWRRLRYQLGLDWIVYVELGFAAMNATTSVLAFANGLWVIGIYAAIFALGLGTVAGASIRQTVTTARAQRHATGLPAQAH
jgi:cellulose synthase/poly-beta-1,6-N-acetylglucosamine synthase-like glycosyltransferase